MTQQGDMAELRRVTKSISALDTKVDAAYARRRQLYLKLRAAGVEHKVIAEAAGVSVPAVIQQCKIAAREASTAGAPVT